MGDSSEPREMGSGGTGEPGIAYDPDRLGEPGQPGVPQGDQYPTNEGDEKREIVADVHIPGPYPSGRGDPDAPPASEADPTKETRDAGSLGDLVQGGGAPTLGGDAGAPSGRVHVSEYDDSPQGKIDQARAESFPGGVPEDADVGTGRQKGQGLPPGSVGKGHDTPQTPVT
jgi:hypothetical protein